MHASKIFFICTIFLSATFFTNKWSVNISRILGQCSVYCIKGLWFYKDGLRSPTTPPPRSRSNSLSPSPIGNSTLSLPTSIQVSINSNESKSIKETPSPQPPAPFANNGQIEPKVITAALASSPKLFQKAERTVNIPAAFVLTPKTTPKGSPAPTPPRTPSPSPPQSFVNNASNCANEQPSRPSRKKTPPVPPPRTNSSLMKKLEIEANNKVSRILLFFSLL